MLLNGCRPLTASRACSSPRRPGHGERRSGLLDRLRSKLGLDRLDIGSGGDIGTANSQNAATPTVSGGKYVAPGVFVGAEQGTSLQSSRAKVEVDLLPHVTGYSSMGADGSNRVGLDWRMDY